jgi:diadenosine tetraphosphate (Ap4A) HIT family hydrolase
VDIWDKTLFESKNFAVFPSLGALVEGWLLIVPKHHVLCLGALSQELHAELDRLRNEVSFILGEFYGTVKVFEHGPAQPNQLVGCSVDHAHLHMIPTQIGLMEGAEAVFPEPLKWEPVSNIQETASLYQAGLPYLYVEETPGNGYVTTHSSLPSQMFRKVIARGIGRPEQYDWRQFHETTNILATVEKLQQRLSLHKQEARAQSGIERTAISLGKAA